jgi:hypothetical protein
MPAFELDELTEDQLDRPIWLVGHSYPANWVGILQGPLDPRHPTRHSIWTPVLEHIQEEVYAGGQRRRVDMNKVLIFNAASKQAPGAVPDWSASTMSARAGFLGRKLSQHKPPMVITFGQDVFAFVTSALSRPQATKKATATSLGRAFRAAVDGYNPAEVNVFPLLHGYVARSGWTNAGKAYFPELDHANYFKEVGTALGRIMLEHGLRLPIWVD